MDWTLEQLKSFVAAAEHGSFSEAGRVLGRAQSVISTHVGVLEAELGMELFNRKGRLPVLTEAGRELLNEAQEVLRRCRHFEARAIARYEGETASMGIAIGEGIPFLVITHTMNELAKRHPFVRLRLLLCTNNEAWQRVEDGDVHFALAYKSDGRHPIHSEGGWVASVNQVIIAAKSHPLASKDRIAPSDLALHRQIVIGDSSHSNVSPVMSTLTWETSDIIVAFHMARCGMGWTLLPAPLFQALQEAIPPSPSEMQLPPHPIILNTEDWQLPPASIMLLQNDYYPNRAIAKWMRQSLEADLRTLNETMNFSWNPE